MFNTTNYQANPTTNLNINAVSGTLIKTFRKSYFKRFHMTSEMAEYYFNEKYSCRIIRSDFNKEVVPIVIIQAMLCGDGNLLVEAIDKEDYDKMFNDELVKKVQDGTKT